MVCVTIITIIIFYNTATIITYPGTYSYLEYVAVM